MSTESSNSMIPNKIPRRSPWYFIKQIPKTRKVLHIPIKSSYKVLDPKKQIPWEKPLRSQTSFQCKVPDHSINKFHLKGSWWKSKAWFKSVSNIQKSNPKSQSMFKSQFQMLFLRQIQFLQKLQNQSHNVQNPRSVSKRLQGEGKKVKTLGIKIPKAKQFSLRSVLGGSCRYPEGHHWQAYTWS